jgi:hypothetical protein
LALFTRVTALALNPLPSSKLGPEVLPPLHGAEHVGEIIGLASGATPVASGSGAASLELAHAAAHTRRPMARLMAACRWPATNTGGPLTAAPVATPAEGSSRGGGMAGSTRRPVHNRGWPQLAPRRLDAAWPRAPVARGDGGRRQQCSGDERP